MSFLKRCEFLWPDFCSLACPTPKVSANTPGILSPAPKVLHKSGTEGSPHLAIAAIDSDPTQVPLGSFRETICVRCERAARISALLRKPSQRQLNRTEMPPSTSIALPVMKEARSLRA